MSNRGSLLQRNTTINNSLIHSVSNCQQKCRLVLLRRLNLINSRRDLTKLVKRARAMLRVLLQTLFLCFLISTVISEKESIYDILKENGLPLGIFPKGVKEFSFDDKTGKFSVSFNQSCEAKYEIELHYDINVSGTIGNAKIGNLSGISAQELFLWFAVKGIRVDVPSSGLIFFDVGVVRKQYSLSLFETPRDCVAVRGIDKVDASMLSLHQVDQTFGRGIV